MTQPHSRYRIAPDPDTAGFWIEERRLGMQGNQAWRRLAYVPPVGNAAYADARQVLDQLVAAESDEP